MTIQELSKLLYKAHKSASELGYGNLTLWQLSQILGSSADEELAWEAEPANLDTLITAELKALPHLYKGAR